MSTLLRRLRQDEHGSAATELVLLTPLLIMLLLFVVFCGRLADARLRVDDAAHQAARAASLARSGHQAVTDARGTAQAALSRAGVTCRSLSVDAQVSGLQPGSTVIVTVSCDIGLSDVALLGVPGSMTADASASSVVDRWRGVVEGGAGS
ncbi:TadE/TadG family type IV pilus assembly protein [Haloechinothrix salitolerans]|uniref:TadE/TadG family type IV pilus assembly protein n=1 Tax=Haloechinothrix salitolerans TaxID=926830 RepID=A0ABW2BXQ2_9PSEU